LCGVLLRQPHWAQTIGPNTARLFERMRLLGMVDALKLQEQDPSSRERGDSMRKKRGGAQPSS
jgi:hypothetical protein